MYSVLPNRVESINFLAIYYMITKNDSALVLLDKALRINPKDCVVLGNMVEYYARKGNAKKRDEYEVKLKANQYE